MAGPGRSFWRWAFIDLGVSGLIQEGGKYLLTLALPALLAVAAAVSAYFQELPWAYLIGAFTFVFAMASGGLLWFNQLREQTTASNKLMLKQIMFEWEGKKDKGGRIIGIEAARYGLLLTNRAGFPISYIVDELTTSIEGRIAKNKKWENTGGVIRPFDTTAFRDAVIQMDGNELKVLEGTLKYKLRFGRLGHEKYMMEGEMKLFTSYDSKTKTFSPLIGSDTMKP